MDPVTLATYGGSALLVVVAAVPATVRTRAAISMVLVVSFVAVCVLSVRWVAQGQWYLPNTEPSRVVRHGVTKLAEALKEPAPNLLVVEGGSYVARAVEPALLRRELNNLGFDVDVVQLALGAANHFERYTLLSDVLRHPKLSRIEQHPNLVFIAESQVNYDAAPLAQFQENLDTSRTYHYITPANGALALWSLTWGGGEFGSLKSPTWDVLRHVLVNASNVGLAERLIPWKKVKSRSGYKQGGIEPGYRFTGLDKVIRAATAPLQPPPDRPWLLKVREGRLKELWGKRLDRWVYFTVPSTTEKQMKWIRSFCSVTKDPCILADDLELLQQLDQKPLWRDQGHLTGKGAAIYTKWLARRLVEHKLFR